MPVALIDRDRIGLDDEVLLLVLFRPRQRRRSRGRVAPDRGAVEVLAPALVCSLKNDNAIREAVGGDDVGHLDLSGGVRTPRLESL